MSVIALRITLIPDVKIAWFGRQQDSTKWLSRLSEITETPISNGNFSLELMCKIPKTGYFGHNKFLSEKEVNVTQQLSVTETDFLHRHKEMSQKQVSF